SEDEEQPGHLLRKRLKCSDEAEDTVYSRAALLTTIVELDALEPDFSIIYIKTVFEFAIGFRVDEPVPAIYRLARQAAAPTGGPCGGLGDPKVPGGRPRVI
ncbi:flavin-binding kelch repeat F-box 1, partial [Striga asiatica]